MIPGLNPHRLKHHDGLLAIAAIVAAAYPPKDPEPRARAPEPVTLLFNIHTCSSMTLPHESVHDRANRLDRINRKGIPFPATSRRRRSNRHIP